MKTALFGNKQLYEFDRKESLQYGRDEGIEDSRGAFRYARNNGEGFILNKENELVAVA